MSVKEAVFPFARFPGSDPVLSPEMKSTGEVMGIDADFPAAFLKSQMGAGMVLPRQGTLFVSVKDSDKRANRRRDPARARDGLPRNRHRRHPEPTFPSRA